MDNKEKIKTGHKLGKLLGLTNKGGYWITSQGHKTSLDLYEMIIATVQPY